MPVKQGLNIKIVTEEDAVEGRIHTKNSMIYDVNGSAAILSQTDPPILKSMLQKEVVITYVVHEERGPVRYGFPAKITEFVDDYELSSLERVKAIGVVRKGESRPYNMRMFYRAEPTSRSSISMTVDDKDVMIIDFSLGGVKFSYDKRLSLVHYEAIHVLFTIDGKPLGLEARILRVWEGGNERSRVGLMFASAEFLNMSMAAEQVLSRKMREIERASQRM